MSGILAAVCCISLMAGCGGSGGKQKAEPIAVGSKDFTESFILTELYALALEDKGFTVERKFNLGGTNVTQTSIVEGELDVYPEYTGTCLLNVLQADLTVAFTTDGQLVDPIFTVLEDDKQAWPPYNIVPIARQDTLDANPGMEEALNAVSAVLDMATMQKLNAEVDINKQEAADVAKAFYDATF